jgi:glycosyltransferase 2 family protein
MPNQSEPDTLQFFSKKLARRMLYAVGLGALAYGGLLFYGDMGAIVGNLRSFPLDVLLAALLLSLLSYAVRCVRWQYYLRISNIRIALDESVLIFVAGLAMSITPAKMGEILKSMMLKEAHDVPVARSGPIIVAERVSDLAGLLVLGGAGFLVIPSGWIGTVVSWSMALFLLLMMKSAVLGRMVIGLAVRFRPLRNAGEKLATAHRQLNALSQPVPTLTSLALSCFSWGLQCVSVSVVAAAFPDAHVALGVALLAYSAPLIAGTLTFLPGGLVLTEASMTGALELFCGPAMTPAIAATVTLVVRFATFWLAIALGFLALALWQWRHRAPVPAK